MNGDGFSSDLDSVAEESTDIPIKNTETVPSYKGDDDILFSPLDKKVKLSMLQDRAYYYVLHAFKAESPAISSSRIVIMQELLKELKIEYKTHQTYHNAIEADPMVLQLRNVSLASDEKEMQKLTVAEEPEFTGVDGQPLIIRIKLNKDDKAKIQDRVLAPAKIKDGKVLAPAKIQDEEAKPSSTSDDSPDSSWGQVSPGSLVGRRVHIQMPDEDEYIEFLITKYDANTETHHLLSAFSNKDYEDPCNWVDLRHVQAEDMKWPEGDPDLPVWKCSPKPGETLFHETSTTQNKKQVHEVGKTSTGIPVIRKVDKGKAVVDA
ncbi:unnamed protein product [Arabidopsis thaliana]|uniref:ENT domain-containing protein n=1 Tax=Arabidopsis thaliana TaxID=3702 RepID=A0A5S9XMI1_ARATH|nr:unnamed protein product [Arabidopsis thaliana]VYS60739.1 unnamed protein product [Arabidopsis thaliana]